MKRIRVASLAEQDLDDIRYRIATQSSSIGIANGVIETITETFPLFANTPEAGTRREEIESGVRRFRMSRRLLPACQKAVWHSRRLQPMRTDPGSGGRHRTIPRRPSRARRSRDCRAWRSLGTVFRPRGVPGAVDAVHASFGQPGSKG